MELEWKAPMEIDDGSHVGEITRIVHRGPPEIKYDYLDIWIRLDGSEVEVKYGIPTNLSPKTKLGKLLISLGEPYVVGKKINPEELLVGKKVRFMTVKVGDFSEIVHDSIKLYL